MVDLVLNKDPTQSDLYNRGYRIYSSPLKKSYVEACLIASRDLQQISTMLEIPLDVITAYKVYFFDIQEYDKLSLLEIVAEEEDPSGKSMKMWALSQGLEFIAWRLGKSVTVSPIGGIQDLLTIAVYKSKEALFSSNNSEASKEATKWTKLSMDLARLIKAWVMDSDEAKSDLQVALASISPEFESFDKLLEVVEDATDPTEFTLGSLVDTFPGLESEDFQRPLPK